MRIVLDTNILVSGVFWSGFPGKILDACVAGQHDFLATPDILVEYLRVISEFSLRVPDPAVASRWIRYLSEMAVLVAPGKTSIVCRDGDDQKFLECAVGGGADLIVSGDADLLVLGDVDGIPIITARKLVTSC